MIIIENIIKDFTNKYYSKDFKNEGYQYTSKLIILLPFLIETGFIFISLVSLIIKFNLISFIILFITCISTYQSINKFFKNNNLMKLKILNLFDNLNYFDKDTKKSYINLLFKENEKKINLGINSEGVYSEQIQKLSNKLQDLTKYSIVNEMQKGRYYFYELNKQEPNRVKLDTTSDFENFLDQPKTLKLPKIPIDNETIINYRDNPHFLIAGTTGSGKTYFLIYLIAALRRQYTTTEINIIDGKNSDLAKSGRNINPNKVATDASNAAKLLREANEKMDERYIKLDQNNTLNSDWYDAGFNPIFIFFDEMATMLDMANKQEKSEIMTYLKSLVNKGRQAGIFLVISTQRPSAEAIDTAVRSQLGVKIALGNIDADGLRMVFGQTYDNIKSVTGKGIGYIKTDNDEYNVPHQIKTPSYNFDILTYLREHSQYFDNK